MNDTEIHAIMRLAQMLYAHQRDLNLYAGEVGDLENILYIMREKEEANERIREALEEEGEFDS